VEGVESGAVSGPPSTVSGDADLPECARGEVELPGLQLQAEGSGTGVAKFDLTFNLESSEARMENLKVSVV